MPINIGLVPVISDPNAVAKLNFHPPVINPTALTTQLRFDDANINDGTVVNSIYATNGIQLAKLTASTPTAGIVLPDPNANGPVYARAYHPAQPNNRNLISLVPNTSSNSTYPTDSSFDERIGIIQISFSNPVRFAAVFAIGVPQLEGALVSHAKVYIRAFDSQNNLIHENDYPMWDPATTTQAPGFGTWMQLSCISTSANIRYLLLSSTAPATGGHLGAAFDTLIYM